MSKEDFAAGYQRALEVFRYTVVRENRRNADLFRSQFDTVPDSEDVKRAGLSAIRADLADDRKRVKDAENEALNEYRERCWGHNRQQMGPGPAVYIQLEYSQADFVPKNRGTDVGVTLARPRSKRKDGKNWRAKRR